MCGWFLPPLSQWKSGHMPFPHQKMRWQVAYYFFFLLETGAHVLKCTTWKCANHRSILLWWNLLSVKILHFCRLGKEAILAHSTMLNQYYFNPCLLLIILHLLKVKWGGFQVTFPQKGGSEPWTVCKDGSFPRCPFGSRTICPFRIRRCADRLANLWKHGDRFRKTDQELIVFPHPGLSREGSAPWECHIAPGSRRTGTTRGTSPRKSSTGDQTGRRTRIRPISGVEEPQNHTKRTPRKGNQLEHCQRS